MSISSLRKIMILCYMAILMLILVVWGFDFIMLFGVVIIALPTLLTLRGLERKQS